MNTTQEKNKRPPGRPKLYEDSVDVQVRMPRQMLLFLRDCYRGASDSRAVVMYIMESQDFVESNVLE